MVATESDGAVVVLDAAGNKDFEVLLTTHVDGRTLEALHKKIHASLGSTCRIETRVSWSHRE